MKVGIIGHGFVGKAVDYGFHSCDKIIIDINKNLKKYGSNSKNIEKTLDYILNRDK